MLNCCCRYYCYSIAALSIHATCAHAHTPAAICVVASALHVPLLLLLQQFILILLFCAIALAVVQQQQPQAAITRLSLLDLLLHASWFFQFFIFIFYFCSSMRMPHPLCHGRPVCCPNALCRRSYHLAWRSEAYFLVGSNCSRRQLTWLPLAVAIRQ